MSLREMTLLGLGLAALTPAAADSAWILSAGGETDDESGYRLDAGAIWLPTTRTAVSALVGRADSTADPGDFTSTAGVLSVDHHFDPVGVALEGRLRRDTDFLDADTIAASLYYKRGPWRLAIEGESRTTDFEPQSFQGEVITRQGVPVTVSATSQCSLDNTGVGLVASYSGSVWSSSVSARQYDYSDADCEFTNVTPALLERFLRVRPDLLPLVAPRLFAFQRLQRSSVTRESTFLEASYGLALGWRGATRSWDLNYYHDREQFAGLQSDTLVGAVTFSVGARSDLELRLGVTDSDIVGTVGFAGVTMYLYVGGI